MRRLILTVAAILLWSTRAFATFGVVQTQNGGDSSGGAVTTVALSNFGSSVTSGNCLAVGMRTAPNNETASISDTLGSSWTLRASDTAQDPHIYVWDTVLSSGGTDAVTVTATAQHFSYVSVFAYELGTGCAVDTAGSASGATHGAATTAVLSPAITTSVAIEIAVMWGSQNAFSTYSTHTDSASNTWTLQNGSVTGGLFGTQYFVTSSTLSADTAQMTSTNSNQYGSGIASYKSSGGTVDTTPPFPINIGGRPFSTPNIMYGPHLLLLGTGLIASTAATVIVLHVIEQVSIIATALNVKKQRALELQRRAARDAMLARFAASETKEYALVKRSTTKG